MDYWDLLKYTASSIFVTITGLIAFFGKSILSRLDKLEGNDREQDKNIAVMESQMDTMQKDIKEIKDGINKLIDKLI